MAFIDFDHALPYLSPTSSPEDTAPMQAFGSADAPVTRFFSQRLLVSYVIHVGLATVARGSAARPSLDEPGALVFVRERDVHTPTEKDELHTRAVENLRRHAAKNRLRFEPRGACHHARLDGQHDASLLLLDELWDAPTRVNHHEGDIVATVPSRSTLVFTGTSTKHGVSELKAHHTKRPSLSTELFVRRDQRWHPFAD